MDAQIKKGILEMVIVYWVSQHVCYGYDLIQQMSIFFPEIDKSTFYAVLRRMYKEGIFTYFIGDESYGPKRKYYKITQKGMDYLQEMISDWNKLKEVVMSIGIK